MRHLLSILLVLLTSVLTANCFTQTISSTRKSATRRTNIIMAMTSPQESTNRMQWIVRPSALDDSHAVTELLMSSYETLLQKDYDAKILKEALPLITSPRPELLTCGTWYVVEHPSTGSLVGCGGWTQENPSTRNKQGHPHVRHVATHPNFLRKGVASAIWNRIRQDITSQSGRDTTLEVFSTLTAQTFYESLGFEAVGSIDIPLTATCKFPSVIMRRPGPI